MSEQGTDFTTKPDHSTVGNVSVRAWLAVLITITICANWTANMVMASLGYTSVNISIPEPLYSAFTMVLGMYFGQAMKK
jgi:hypothetical protein